MIRVFRCLAFVGCGMGAAGVGISLWNMIDNNFFVAGTANKLGIMVREMIGPMILLVFSGVLYVTCEIADRLRKAGPADVSDEPF